MSLTVLLLIAGGATWAVMYLISTYVPLYKEVLGREYSPRLMLCKFLAPADAMLTIILVCGPWVGFTTAALGISMIVYNVLTGIGISIGVMAIRKWFVPRWEEQFEFMCQQNMEKLK